MVVTHRRPDELAKSLDALAAQTRAPDHLVVVDNDTTTGSRDLVTCQPIPSTYLGSRRNLGGAGGFALGMLHALATGRRLVVAGRRRRTAARARCARHLAGVRRQAFTRRGVADGVRHGRSRATGVPAAPRSGMAPPGQRTAHRGRRPGPAARNRIVVQRRAVPGVHRGGDRRTGSAAVRARRRDRTAPEAGAVRVAIRHVLGRGVSAPAGPRRVQADTRRPDAHPVPDDATKRFFTYRNRGYLLSQPGLRRLLPQEWLRFGWYFLVSRRDPAGLREWIRLRRLGRRRSSGGLDE